MALETNTVEIENLSLLKFRAPIDGSERWQTCALGAILRPHSNHHGSLFVRHRIEVIDRFEVTWKKLFLRLFHFLFLSLYDLLHFHFLRNLAIEPIDTGRVRTKIESQRRIIAQELHDRRRMFVVE